MWPLSRFRLAEYNFPLDHPQRGFRHLPSGEKSPLFIHKYGAPYFLVLDLTPLNHLRYRSCLFSCPIRPREILWWTLSCEILPRCTNSPSTHIYLLHLILSSHRLHLLLASQSYVWSRYHFFSDNPSKIEMKSNQHAKCVSTSYQSHPPYSRLCDSRLTISSDGVRETPKVGSYIRHPFDHSKLAGKCLRTTT